MISESHLPRPLTREDFEAAWTERPDEPDKATGRLRYLTDELDHAGLLHGRILRAPMASARIRHIDTAAAAGLPGVHAVVTAADIPSLNRFGIVIQDQPVFCEDRVRCVGEALAAVAADTPEIAARALTLIQVEYEPLAVVDSPERALSDDAPCLHPDGNLLAENHIRTGDTAAAFERCTVVVEDTYTTPRQMHVYMETEGGIAIPDRDGGLTLRFGSQHPHRDRLQLARILGLDEALIRVVCGPTGGAFGGKDELTVQPAAGLLALKTGRPVRIHLSRAESAMCGIKRHPVALRMRTGCDADGRILAHQMLATADTGAYASLGPSVIENILEHGAAAAYNIPNLDVVARLVYTNNGVAGAFRGFGGNQATFAVESQIHRLAVALGMAPETLRRRNLRAPGQPGVRGQAVRLPCPADPVLDAAAASPLWTRRHAGRDRWRSGVGLALGLQGNGLGSGLEDPGGGRVELTADGRIRVSFGFIEYGQGVLPAVRTLALEILGCGPESLEVILNDTTAPESGSTSASRTTVVALEALRRLRRPWRSALLEAAAEVTGRPAERLRVSADGIQDRDDTARILTYAELASASPEAMRPQVETTFDFPVGPDPHAGGRFLYAWIATLARVSVDTLTGRVRVTDLHHVTAAGRVIHPPSYLGQIEGGALMGVGMTIMERFDMTDGIPDALNLDGYWVPMLQDAPRQRVDVIEAVPDDDGPGLRGVGELGIEAVSPAITAAIHDAVGVQVAHLPVDPAALLDALSDPTRETPP